MVTHNDSTHYYKLAKMPACNKETVVALHVPTKTGVELHVLTKTVVALHVPTKTDARM